VYLVHDKVNRMTTVRTQTLKKAASHELHRAQVRRALVPKREPNWSAALARGQHVGFRKISADAGSWIARYRPEDGKQDYHSLGLATDQFGFDEAKTAAAAWFKLKESGVADTVVTVATACRECVTDRRREKGDATAEKRFERTVYDNPLGARRLALVTFK
jgi:hypothetical protein